MKGQDYVENEKMYVTAEEATEILHISMGYVTKLYGIE